MRPLAVNMRRLCLSWVLSLALLLAQQGAMLHELSHLSHAGHSAGSALSAELQATEGGLCPTCEAFAQIVNPAAAGATDLAVCPAAIIPAPDPCFTIVGTDAPTPRSRGPPQA
jgi:hypothetical protein